MVDAHPELPYAKLWLVTDIDLPVINRGVLFYSKTEALKFVEMYDSLSDYVRSDFYKYKGVSIQIQETALPIFEKELLDYLKVRENRFWSQLIKTTEVLDEHFTDEAVCLEGSEVEIIQINFPEAVSQREVEKYFPQTLKCRVTEEDKKQLAANKDKFQSTAVYDELASYADEWSDSETEVDDSTEEFSEVEEYEQDTAAGKEKPISYLYRHSDREEVVPCKPTTAFPQTDSRDLASQAGGKLTKESAAQSSSVDSDLYSEAGGTLTKKSALAQSMSKGVFKTKEKAAPSDELAKDSDITYEY